MKKAFCLMNHILTDKQIDELHKKYLVDEIIYPEPELSKLWSQIPATEEFSLKPVKSAISWLSSAVPGDILVVQGEFGSTFMLVDYAMKKGLVPVYAVSERISREVKIGEQVVKQNIFEHVCFRKYEIFF